MPASKPLEFLEELQPDFPDLADDVSQLAALFQKKLWHQLTLKVEACYSQAAWNRGDLPIRLYQNFISEFGHKINLLKLAQFAVHASKYFASGAASIEFLNSTVAKLEEFKLPRVAEPILFVRMHVAQHELETGETAKAKSLIDAGEEQLGGMSDVDPSVSASVFYVASLLHKASGDYSEFYRSSLMYLSYVSSETLPADFKLRLAVDISLAALLGNGLYSFGQLLQHPIVDALVGEGSPYGWLRDLLLAFSAGDIHRYDELCVQHAAQLNAQPALVANERRLREKITIMCLVDIISSTPAEERRIPLATIAQRTKLSIDGVEFLLMKALALHLIEGSIDQVDSTVQVSWVQPRILTKPQIQDLKERLDVWIGKVNAAAVALEQDMAGVVEVA